MGTWRPVRGYEGLYEVALDGRVRSLPRATTRGKILTPTPSAGYPAVTLSRQGKPRTIRVHVLVADAWLDGDGEVRHRDGARIDPGATNLERGTRAQNVADQVRDGVHAAANATHCPFDHEYAPCNLVRSRVERVCLACARGNSTVQNARRRGVALDKRVEADRHYVEIMAGRAPERRRRAKQGTAPRSSGQG